MFIHVDIDCFYCSAQRIKDSSLFGKPIAVCNQGDLRIFDLNSNQKKSFYQNRGTFMPKFVCESEFDESRGLVLTSSYEARAFGVETGMGVNEAKKLCPKIVLLKPEYGYYHQLSTDLFLLLCEHIPHVKQASIDEFYCDINGLNVEPYQFAQNIKKLVLDKIGLPISIGIAHTPHIAKLATTMAKPDGVLHVPKEKFLDFIESIPVKKFAGVGKSYLKKMKKYNINTLGEAYRAKHILHNWGKYGKDLHSKISGECEELQSHSDRKSIGISKTFEPLKDRVELKRRVLILLRHLSFLVSKLDVVPTTYQFGIKYQNGVKFSSQNSIDRHFSEKLLKDTILAIYHKIDIYPQLHVLYISISLSSFLQNSKKSLSILDFNEDEKAGKITKSLHKIRQIYGIDSIYLADELLASSEKVSLD